MSRVWVEAKVPDTSGPDRYWTARVEMVVCDQCGRQVPLEYMTGWLGVVPDRPGATVITDRPLIAEFCGRECAGRYLTGIVNSDMIPAT